MVKRIGDHKSEYALGMRTPAADSIAQTVPSTQYYDNLRAEGFITTCFGNATLETLKISSPYPTLGESIYKYTKQRTGVSETNSKCKTK